MTMHGVTPLLSRTSYAAGNGRFWNIHRTHPIWLHAITISSPKWKNTARGPVQHKIWTYPCYRAVNTEHQQRCTRWWCTTPSKHLGKVINKGWLYWRYINVVPLWINPCQKYLTVTITFYPTLVDLIKNAALLFVEFQNETGCFLHNFMPWEWWYGFYLEAIKNN